MSLNTTHIYQDKASKWRWRRIAANGVEIDRSTRGYRFRWYAKLRVTKLFPGDKVKVVSPSPVDPA